MNHKDCDHERLTYKGTDTDGAPDAVYVEWYCDDCDALLSNVYEPADHRIVFPDNDDEPYEEAIGDE